MRKKKLPNFNTIEEESKFWEQNDSTDYFDWSKAKMAKFPNLKSSAATTTISLKLPEELLKEIKAIAQQEEMPYQSLMTAMLAQEVFVKRQNSKKTR